MPTPESKVKDQVKDRLHAVGIFPFLDVGLGLHPDAEGIYYMPVAGPMAVHGVHDFVGCYRGVFWSIETKAEKNPEDETEHQRLFRLGVSQTGGVSLTGVRDASAVDQLVSAIDRRLQDAQVE